MLIPEKGFIFVAIQRENKMFLFKIKVSFSLLLSLSVVQLSAAPLSCVTCGPFKCLLNCNTGLLWPENPLSRSNVMFLVNKLKPLKNLFYFQMCSISLTSPLTQLLSITQLTKQWIECFFPFKSLKNQSVRFAINGFCTLLFFYLSPFS